MHKIDYKTFNVRAVRVLIRHNHDGAIPKAFDVIILFVDLQAYYLHEVLDFLVFE